MEKNIKFFTETSPGDKPRPWRSVAALSVWTQHYSLKGRRTSIISCCQVSPCELKSLGTKRLQGCGIILNHESLHIGLRFQFNVNAVRTIPLSPLHADKPFRLCWDEKDENGIYSLTILCWRRGEIHFSTSLSTRSSLHAQLIWCEPEAWILDDYARVQDNSDEYFPSSQDSITAGDGGN